MSSSRFSSSLPTVASRCFRTDADGRIPLQHDWPALFRAVAPLGDVALQTRHACARLIHFGRLPELAWDSTLRQAHDPSGTLRLECSAWGPAFARIARCDCCGSPGRIEFLNTRGAEFLQLCASGMHSPARWAACLDEIAAPHALASIADPTASGFVVLPESIPLLAARGESLPALFSALCEAALPLRLLLRTPEAAHLRTLVPEQVAIGHTLLGVVGDGTTLELALPSVHALALAPDDSLHVVGPDRALLLSLAAANGSSSSRWSAAVHALLAS